MVQTASLSATQPGFILHRQVRTPSRGLWWMSLPAYCSPTITVWSSRTLERMIRATLLTDIVYGTQLSQDEFGSVISWSYYKCISLLVPSSALEISRSKRLFIISSMWCSDPTEREGKWNGLQFTAFIVQLEISIPHKLVLSKVLFATSGLCLTGN